MRRVGLIGVLITAGVAFGAPAGAIVPPRDCGFTKVSHKRYNIKADQLRCSEAVPFARTYLGRHHKPRGYHCVDYHGGTSLKFRCSRGIKVFFAIRR